MAIGQSRRRHSKRISVMPFNQIATTTSVADREDLCLSYDALQTALAESKIRELRWAILFAQSEPEFFPYPDRDPDTGEVSPFRNDDPTDKARSLAWQVTENPVAMRILADAGWTEETLHADWNTMLKYLPIPATLPGHN
jgi:hypothetical protein